MDAMIQMMASAPEEERKQMMTDRLKMFAAMPEDQRVESIAQLIVGFSRLPPAQREELVAARTLIIANLSEGERKSVIVGHMKAGRKVGPEIHRSDMELTNKAALRLPDGQKIAFVDSMDAVKSEMPEMAEAPPTSVGVPEHHGKPMELKGLLGKKYVCSVCGFKQPA